MRLLIQRVSEASVTVNDKVVGSIKQEALVLHGIHDENDKMNLSLKDIGGAVLIVLQFTLYVNCQQGRPHRWQSSSTKSLSKK